MSELSHYPGGERLVRLLDAKINPGERVFLRCDFNVPIKDGIIQDSSRIDAAIPTIELLLRKQARIVCASHLGRPTEGADPKLSLEPIAEYLSQKLNNNVYFAHDAFGDAVVHQSKSLLVGEILLLENLRFHYKDECENNKAFSYQLSQLADSYVNDAFGVCHRAHASVASITDFFKNKACGLLLEKEIKALSEIAYAPQRPLITILGGAKVSDKINVIEALMKKSHKIIIGGAMAHTFCLAEGHRLGKSLIEESKVPLARKILQNAHKHSCKIVLPVDFTAAPSLESTEESISYYEASNFPQDQSSFDIGPKSQELFARELVGAQSVFWNGPLGVFEKNLFSKGTMALTRTISQLDSPVKICGGGDSVAAVKKMQAQDYFQHISTGGGASLELIEGKKLPGIESLKMTTRNKT